MSFGILSCALLALQVNGPAGRSLENSHPPKQLGLTAFVPDGEDAVRRCCDVMLAA